ncbi:MAG: 50S ribosomal protein L5 [Opitutales bacterium]
MSNPVLKKFYQESIVPEMKKLHGYKNIHEVPKLEKIVINSAFAATLEKKEIAETQKEISLVAGQHAVTTKARKSVSNFKLRDGMPIGTMVTLRGAAMYEFLYRLISVALPGIRDFRGVKEKFDGNGNYTLGITDHTIFAEVHSDGSKRNIGMDICIVTTAATDAEGYDLLRLFGMPFRKKQASAA